MTLSLPHSTKNVIFISQTAISADSVRSETSHIKTDLSQFKYRKVTFQIIGEGLLYIKKSKEIQAKFGRV